MFTEDEAREKICPHMTYCENPYQVREGQAALLINQSCIASQCMAWRWKEERMTCGKPARAGLGYCGLGGREGA